MKWYSCFAFLAKRESFLQINIVSDKHDNLLVYFIASSSNPPKKGDRHTIAVGDFFCLFTKHIIELIYHR